VIFAGLTHIRIVLAFNQPYGSTQLGHPSQVGALDTSKAEE